MPCSLPGLPSAVELLRSTGVPLTLTVEPPPGKRECRSRPLARCPGRRSADLLLDEPVPAGSRGAPGAPHLRRHPRVRDRTARGAIAAALRCAGEPVVDPGGWDRPVGELTTRRRRERARGRIECLRVRGLVSSGPTSAQSCPGAVGGLVQAPRNGVHAPPATSQSPIGRTAAGPSRNSARRRAVATVSPQPGGRRPGARSASGASTKRRSRALA